LLEDRLINVQLMNVNYHCILPFVDLPARGLALKAGGALNEGHHLDVMFPRRHHSQEAQAILMGKEEN